MNNLTATIDRLGIVKSQLATLKREEEQLKGVLIEHGPGAYEGELYRATVTESEAATLDMDAVRAKLSAQFIQAHTKITPVTTVRVSARIGKKIRERA